MKLSRAMRACEEKLYVLLALILVIQVGACPKRCVCKWKNGKQTVECNDKGLLSIPAGMDIGTQVLDFSGNRLQQMEADIFIKMELINLQRIYLSRCRIRNIDDRTFNGLTNLVELDLSSNLLEVVPTDVFTDCPSLMRLTLNANPIKAVGRAAFNHLSFLNTLELSDCEISTVEDNAFHGLNRLEWLHLDGNKLTTLRRVLPDNLKGVELQGNLWMCDCHLLELHSWLETFSIPHSVEPICSNPPRLNRRSVKSITAAELACLPDVSPTTFYLEIGEGKNVSLICHIHATPAARVSWYFDGQLLQNDTFISPGLRLLYFIEEGSEDKRSELYIYNANVEDNGTFVCSAENAAGIMNANYTIRIIVKEEPLIIVVAFPFEYILAAIVGTVALFIIIIITIIICLIKCRRSRLDLKRDKTKEVASSQYQQHTSTKCSVIREEYIEESPEPMKTNDVQQHELHEQQEVMFYNAYPSAEVLRTMSPVAIANQLRSPMSLRRYQLEQNPDLINDTESGRRKDADGATREDSQESTVTEIVQQPFPISCMRGSRKLYSLHSWDAGCSLDSDGYPPDYGLPKIQSAPAPTNENFYRTLPYNRAAKRSAANPVSRYSREAEFLSRSVHPASYEHYCPDVRYTADGYPVRPDAEPLPSPPDAYKTAPSSLPCTSSAAPQQWPSRVPANLHMINSSQPLGNQSKYASVSKQRCHVGAQTEAEQAAANKTDSNATEHNEAANEILTESPDEGYEGEPGIVL